MHDIHVCMCMYILVSVLYTKHTPHTNSNIIVMHTLTIVFFVFLNVLNVYPQDIYGFDFEDNKAPKYLTEKNGVAEISVKEGLFFCPIHEKFKFFF